MDYTIINEEFGFVERRMTKPDSEGPPKKFRPGQIYIEGHTFNSEKYLYKEGQKIEKEKSKIKMSKLEMSSDESDFISLTNLPLPVTIVTVEGVGKYRVIDGKFDLNILKPGIYDITCESKTNKSKTFEITVK